MKKKKKETQSEYLMKSDKMMRQTLNPNLEQRLKLNVAKQQLKA